MSDETRDRIEVDLELDRWRELAGIAAVGPFEVVKRSTVVPMPDRLLADRIALTPPTTEQAAANRAAYERQYAAEQERHTRLRDRLLAAAGPLGRRILRLHDINDDGECAGCDPGSYAESGAGWPCSTVDAVAEYYGIETP